MTTAPDTGGIQKELRSGGPLAKYRSMATGARSPLYFVVYEMFGLLATAIPSSVGVFLRRLLYRILFREFGGHVTIGEHVLFRRPGSIRMGDRVRVGDHASLVAKSDTSTLDLANDVQIGSHTILSCNGGKMRFAEGVRVGEHVRLGSLEGLEVGEKAVLEEGVCVSGAGHETARLDIPIIMQPLTCAGMTTIGARVRVGRDSTVLDGVTLGDDVVVEPGSLVTRDVAAGLRVGGVPAKEVS